LQLVIRKVNGQNSIRIFKKNVVVTEMVFLNCIYSTYIIKPFSKSMLEGKHSLSVGRFDACIFTHIFYA